MKVFRAKKGLKIIVSLLFIFQLTNIYSQSLDSLNLKTKTLDDVTVSALKNTKKIGNGKITYTIENSMLANLGFGFDVIRSLPELQYDGEKLLMRQKPVTLFIDGVQINSITNNLQTALSSVASNEIERIEIISNPNVSFQSNVYSIVKIWTIKMKSIGELVNINGQVGVSKHIRNVAGIKYSKKAKKFIYSLGLNNTFSNYNTIYKSERFLIPSNIYFIDNSLQNTKGKLLGIKGSLNYDFDSTLNWQLNVGNTIISRKRHEVYTSNISENGTFQETYNTDNKQFYNDFIIDNKLLKKNKIGEFYFNSYITNHNNEYSDKSILNNGNILNMPSTGVIKIYNQNIGYIKRTASTEVEFGIGYNSENQKINYTYINAGIENNDLSSNYVYAVNNKFGYASFNQQFEKSSLNLGLRYENLIYNAVENTNETKIRKEINFLLPKLSFNKKFEKERELTLSYSAYTNPPDFFSLGKRLAYYSPVSFKRGGQLILPENTNLVECNFVLSESISFTTTIAREKNREIEIPLIQGNRTVINQVHNSNRFDIGMLDVSVNKNIGKINFMAFFQVWNSANFFEDKKINTTGGLINLQSNVILNKIGKLGLIYNLQSKNRTNFVNILPIQYLELNYAKTFKSGVVATLTINDVFNTNILGFEFKSKELISNDSFKYETRIFRLGLSYKFGNKNIKALDLLNGNKRIKY